MTIDKEDLEMLKCDLKTHMSEIMKPVMADIEKKNTVLFGVDGRSGLVGDVNEIKTRVTIFKWIAGIGGSSGIGSAIHHIFGGK